MRFEYDETADALYIGLVTSGSAIVAATLQVDRGTLIDVDTRGTIIGIEVLHPARDWPVDAVLASGRVPDGAEAALRHFFGPGALIATFPFERARSATELTNA